MVTNNVDMEEANILADFFNLQATKHGPEMIRKLNNIGGLKVHGQESLVVAGKQSEVASLEQRKQIKIEVEAETVINQEIKLEVGRDLKSHTHSHPSRLTHPLTHSAPLQLLLSAGQPEPRLGGAVQYLLSQDGKLVPLVTSLTSLTSDCLETTRPRGVSVIQRAPGPGSAAPSAPANPNIILERRVEEVSVYSHSPPGESRHRMIDTTTAGSQDTSQSGVTTVGVNSFQPKHSGGSKTGSNSTNIALKGRKSNQQQSDHLICEVCGERAGKHSYYGGQVCPSCRAFFRRSVQSRYNETFKCTKGRADCHISLMTRKNCQFCRYQKCLLAGMRPSWILSDEERVRRFHGRVRPEKTKPGQLQGSDVAEVKYEEDVMECDEDTTSVKSGTGSLDSDTSSCEPREITKGVVGEFTELIKKVFTGRHDDLSALALTDLMSLTMHGTCLTSLTPSTATQLNSVLETRTRACLLLLPEFQCLHPGDQRTILEQNLPLIHRFRQALCLNSSLSWSSLVQLLIGEEKLREEALNLPTDLSGKEVEREGFQYSNLFSGPGAAWAQSSTSSETERKTRGLMEEISAWVDTKDHIQLTLLVLILAFNHDFLDLKGRSLVEKIQLKFVMVLQSHLRSVHTSSVAASKLTKAVMLPAVTRELVHLTKKKMII